MPHQIFASVSIGKYSQMVVACAFLKRSIARWCMSVLAWCRTKVLGHMKPISCLLLQPGYGIKYFVVFQLPLLIAATITSLFLAGRQELSSW